MAEGLVTFFKYKELGFYQNGGSYHQPLDLELLLEDMLDWYNDRISLEDTLPWDPDAPGYQNRKRVYLKSIEKNEDTGDYILILWRAVGSGDSIYGIKSSASLRDNQIYNANDAVDGEDVIWGEPAYYWFIPSLSIFASIRFPSSVADTNLMNEYIKQYVLLQGNLGDRRSEVKISTRGIEYTSIYFSGPRGMHLWFRAKSEQYKKITKSADLGRIASEITSFVKRDVISASVVKDKDWTRFFSGFPFVSSERTKNSRRIEIVMDAKPTGKELSVILDYYNQQYASRADDDWANIGFRKEGVGGTFWLNQFVVKSILNIPEPQGQNDSGHYTPNKIFTALHLRRDILLAPFSSVSVDDTEEDMVL